MFYEFWGPANLLLHIPLKMQDKMKNILSHAYSSKLKNIILFLNQGLIFIFYKWSYAPRCFNVAQRFENLHWKRKRCLDVV